MSGIDTSHEETHMLWLLQSWPRSSGSNLEDERALEGCRVLRKLVRRQKDMRS